MQLVIRYTLEVLHPATGEPLALRVRRFNDWSEVETQIIADKKQFVDMAHCTMKYAANDSQVELTGSYGA